MRVLVTGSAGFLGGHICRGFQDAGWSVTAFDVEPTSIEGVAKLTGDLLDAESVKMATRGQDVVAHVAAVGDVYLAAERPELAAQVNVVGSSNIARAAADAGARVVYASTWEVYGAPRYEPVDEDHPTEPDHPYNITKLAGEQLLLANNRLHGVPTVALRLGTAYGQGMRLNSVFEIFIRKAMGGEPITIQGDGSQGRQFTHASDIARAFVEAAKSEEQGVAMNIVSPEVVSIKQLAERVIAEHPTEVTFGEPRPGDVPPSVVSSDRARQRLGWEPQVGFEEGMRELLAVPR